MEPVIPDGAHVLIRQQQDAENGEIVAVMSEDMEVTLKYFKKMNGTIMLIPENNEYENILITEKNPIKIVVRLYPKTGNKKTPADQTGVVSCYVISFCGDTPEHQ